MIIGIVLLEIQMVKAVECLVRVIVYVLGNILQDIQQVVIICLQEITTHRQVGVKFNSDSIPVVVRDQQLHDEGRDQCVHHNVDRHYKSTARHNL